jgi:hypothetical protein
VNLVAYSITVVRQRFHIFPVKPGEKTPHKLFRGKPYTIRWSEEATRDLNRVIEIWTWSPSANIG